jgi:ubiquinone/menaquinone biosynthesis C-methylase UbiE
MTRHPSDVHGDFDHWAATYDQSFLQRLFFDRVHARVARAVAAAVRGAAAPHVVDVGCGTGRLLVRLSEALPHALLTGVDASAGMIAVAAEKPALSGVALLVGSAAALPLDDSSCDVVVSTISFHHWDDQAAGLRDVARVLRPGGRLLLVDFLVSGPLGPLVRRRTRAHGVGWRDESELLRMCNAASLQAASLRRLGPPGSPLAMMTATRP